MNATDFFLFATAATMAAMVPGPISLLAISMGMSKSRIVSVSGGLGNSVASAIQVILAYLLVVYAFSHAHSVLRVVTLLGGCYMLYLGVMIFLKNPFQYQSDKCVQENQGNKKKAFLNAFFLTLANPKAIIFFLALFPQLIMGNVHGKVSVYVVTVLTVIIIAVAFFTFLANALIGSVLDKVIKTPRVSVILCVVFASILGVIGLSSIATAI